MNPLPPLPIFADTSGRAPRWLLVVLVVVGITAQAFWTWKPVVAGFALMGFPHHNAARYAIAGRNYVRHGFTEHLGAPDLTPGNVKGEEPRLYLHHPPAVPLIVGASLATLGETERAAQWPFFALGLLVPLALFVLARRCLDGAGPGYAALFVAIAPLSLLYGGHVDPQGPLVTLSVILSTWGYLRFRESRATFDLALVAAFAVVGLLSDWSAAYPLGVIAVLDRFLPGGTKDRRVLALPLVPIVFFAGYLAWIAAIGLPFGEALFAGAGVRSLAGLGQDSGGALSGAIANLGHNVLRMFTVALLAFAAIGIVPSLWKEGGAARIAFLVLLLTGLAHIVLFPQGALVHDYWMYLLVPPLALAAAMVPELVRERVSRWQGEGFGVLVSVALCAAVFLPGRQEVERTLETQRAGGRLLPHAMLGRAIRELVRPNQRVLTNLPHYNPTSSRLMILPEFTWYSDRVVRGMVRSNADLERAVAEEGQFDRFALFDLADPIVADLEANHALLQTVTLEGVRIRLFDLKPN